MTDTRYRPSGRVPSTNGDGSMSTIPLEGVAFESALAMLWQRHRQANVDLISLLEMTTASVLRSEVDVQANLDAAGAAHRLAGSLGTFGFDAGSRAALEAESLLRKPTVDGRLLAEAVTSLRASVEKVGGTTGAVLDPAMTNEPPPSASFATGVISLDADLISRLTVEAAAVGIVLTSGAELPSTDELDEDPPSAVVVDDEVGRSWKRSELLSSISEISRQIPVIVLTDRDAFEDRVQFARAGAAGVLPRTQEVRQTISFLVEALDRRTTPSAKVLATNVDGEFVANLHAALPAPGCRLHVRDDAADFWVALEDQGADLVVAGFEGPHLSGPELCRMVRSHPRWQHLPLIVVGNEDPDHSAEAMDAGADDYLHPGLSPRDLGIRVRHHMDRGRMVHDRCETDPLTGTENKAAAERSLDHLLRLAMRRDEPLALALIAVDQFDQIRQQEGNAMGDIVLRRLGTRLLEEFHGEGVVGRWAEDGFAVGIYGSTAEDAYVRMAGIQLTFAAEALRATSGMLTRYSFSAGVASFPGDSSTLSSLDRLATTALRRAMTRQASVLIAGERPIPSEQDVVDVVLVDDDGSFADVIEHALRLHHYTFRRFSDGAEAARALGEGTVKGHVVLLDVGLPSLDGYGVLQVLRNQGVLEDTRVIMLTARSSEAEMLRGLGLGATEHITKPFSVPVLLGRLDQTRFRSIA
jgi:diguanylate cyclase (GGDEF)-like protein